MTATQQMQAWRWTLAECQMIAVTAHERFISVEPWEIHMYLDIWRRWYYGMLPDSAVMQLPGVRHISVSGR